MRELGQRHQGSEHEHLDHAPRPHRLDKTEHGRQSLRDPPEPQGQQHVEHCPDVEQRHQDRRDKDKRGHAPHLVVVKRANRAEQCRRGPVALCLESDHGKQIGHDQQDGSRERERESAVETVRLVAVESRAAAYTARGATGRKDDPPLQQIAFMTGDERVCIHIIDSRAIIESRAPQDPKNFCITA